MQHTPSQYEVDATRTVSDQYNTDVLNPDHTTYLMNEAVKVMKIADAYKRSLFYSNNTKFRELGTFMPMVPETHSYLPCTADPRGIDLLHAGLGFLTEAVEFLEGVFNYISIPLEHWERTPLAQVDRTNKCLANLREEVGDIQWYAALAARALATPLSAIQDGNIAKLKKRFPEKFTTAGAVKRDTTEEINAMQQVINDIDAMSKSPYDNPDVMNHVPKLGNFADLDESVKLKNLVWGTANQMWEKLERYRCDKGYTGWDDYNKGMMQNLVDGFQEAVESCDWISVCNFAAMFQFHTHMNGMGKVSWNHRSSNTTSTESRILALEEALGQTEDKPAIHLGKAMQAHHLQLQGEAESGLLATIKRECARLERVILENGRSAIDSMRLFNNELREQKQKMSDAFNDYSCEIGKLKRETDNAVHNVNLQLSEHRDVTKAVKETADKAYAMVIELRDAQG